MHTRIRDAVHTEEASLVTLDSVLQEQQALFLKIDVAGFEKVLKSAILVLTFFLVLRGARKWLAKRSASAIDIEFTPKDLLAVAADPQSVVHAILRLGYYLHSLSSGGVPLPLVPVDHITQVCNATARHQCDLFFKRISFAARA